VAEGCKLVSPVIEYEDGSRVIFWNVVLIRCTTDGAHCLIEQGYMEAICCSRTLVLM